MQSKIRIGVLFGGQSAEHEVSLQSAKSVMEHLNEKKYEIFPVGIDREGGWHYFEPEKYLGALQKGFFPTFQSEDPHFPELESLALANFSPAWLKAFFDVIFPVLHGPKGEDGTVQGMLELANIPYVGSDHLSSAMCMDKGVMKRLLKHAEIPTPEFFVLDSQYQVDIKKILDTFSFPIFVKPAQMGSSVGVNKVHTFEELHPAIEEAFRYDERLLIEEYIEGRELECSILGNENPIVSLPGEIIPTHEFYSYESKYLDDNGARFILPAEIPDSTVQELQDLAIAAFKALHCSGMARIDFFLNKKGKLFLNELNTIPGFTTISLYPKLWSLSGLPYSELLDRLIAFALERAERKKKKASSFEIKSKVSL